MKRITCLMLDMGGVLTREHRLEKVDELMATLDLDCPRETFLQAYFAERPDYDRGVIEGPEYWLRVARVLGAKPAEPLLSKLVALDLESWFNRRAAMFELLGGIRKKVGCMALLSNIHFDGARYLRREEGRDWVALFDFLVLSCEHRLLKPEPRIYELALGTVGARPDETLFVDDSPANVEGARASGLSSFVFTGEADFAARLAAEYELAR